MPDKTPRRMERSAFALARAVAPKALRETTLAEWQESLPAELSFRQQLSTASQVLTFATQMRLGKIASTAIGKTSLWVVSALTVWLLAETAPWALVILAVGALQFAKGDLRVDLILSRRSLTFAQISLLSCIALANLQPLVFAWMQWQGPFPAERLAAAVELENGYGWFAALAQVLALAAVIGAWLAALDALLSLRRRLSWSALISLIWATASTSIAIWLFLRNFPRFTSLYSNPDIQRTLGNIFLASASLATVLVFGLTFRRNRSRIKDFINYESAIAGLVAAALALLGIQQSTAGFPIYAAVTEHPIAFDDFRSQLTPELKSEMARDFSTLSMLEQEDIWILSRGSTFRASSPSAQAERIRTALSRIWEPSALTERNVSDFARAINNLMYDANSAATLTDVTVSDDLIGFCELPNQCILRFSASKTWTQVISGLHTTSSANYQVELQKSNGRWRFTAMTSWGSKGDG